jgi:hypothetical protein
VNTPYDWATIGIFAALVVLFLQRSADAEPKDKLWQYAPPTIGCAIANYLGNQGMHGLAVLALLTIIAYTLIFLKPFNFSAR